MNTKTIALAAAFAALTQAQIAQAQQAAPDCLKQEDLSDAVVYAMPQVIEGIRGTCATTLNANGFLMRSDQSWLAPYTARKDEAWPGMKRAFLVFAKQGEAAPVDLSTLPAEALRPLFDQLIPGLVTQNVPVSECAEIERGLELVSPLPPENAGGIVALAMKLAGRENPSVCAFDD